MNDNSKKTERPVFLDVKELAEMMHVKPRTIYHWVQNDLIPYRKPGGGKGRILFLLDEILEWTKLDAE